MLEGLLVIKCGFKVLVVLQSVLTWVITLYKHLKSRVLQMPPRVHARMPLQFQSEACGQTCTIMWYVKMVASRRNELDKSCLNLVDW